MTTIDKQKPLMKIEAAAKRLQVKPNTLRKWLRKGYIPGLKISSTWRLTVENLEDFIKFRETETKREIKEGKI